jgi:hypothetical protein
MMALKVARFVNVIPAGILTGNEFGGWAAVHPVLSSLPTRAHIQAEQAAYRRYRENPASSRYLPATSERGRE